MRRIWALALGWKIAIACGVMAIVSHGVHSQEREVPPSDMSALNGAFAAIDAKQYRAAEERLHLISSSKNPVVSMMAFEGLAHMYRRTGQYSKVVTAYDAAIAKGVAFPKDLEAFHRLAGQAAVMASNYDGAVSHLTKWKAYLPFVATPPADGASVLAFLAIAYAERREFSDAMTAIDAALSAADRENRGLVKIREAIRSASEARETFVPGSIAGMVRPR